MNQPETSQLTRVKQGLHDFQGCMRNMSPIVKNQTPFTFTTTGLRLCWSKSLVNVFNTRQLSIYQSRTVLANKSLKIYSFLHRPVRCCLFDFVSRHAMLMNRNYMLPSARHFGHIEDILLLLDKVHHGKFSDFIWIKLARCPWHASEPHRMLSQSTEMLSQTSSCEEAGYW